MLHINNVEKTYGKKRALYPVQLEIKRGSCFGLVGPNGAGKSTLMKIIATIIEADKGEVIMEEGASLGYVPQEICLEEQLSAQANLVYFGQLYGLHGLKLKERVNQVLAIIGLSERRQDKVMNFSGGMKRRLHIGCGLIHEPSILLLDEPTVGVDPQSRKYIFDLLEQLTKQGTTIIYASHYMEEVEQLCDAIAFIDEGKIIEANTMDDLLRKYAKPQVFVKGFDTFPLIDGVYSSSEHKGGYLLTTDKPFTVMEQLLERRKAHDVKLDRMELVKPRLADVFFSLTGTHLRDE